jgi:hypothetical protein
LFDHDSIGVSNRAYGLFCSEHERCGVLRTPDGYASPLSRRARRKWEPIIAAFQEGRMEDLNSIQRTGARGRIFSHLIAEALMLLEIPCQCEPVFEHRDPDPWYVDFAEKNGLKLRTHRLYNPDFVLEDGSWLEATLSENSAYKKLFLHGHQAPRLSVIWLDKDTGLHKDVCQCTDFPNARVKDVAVFYSRLARCTGGESLIAGYELLRSLKGRLL